MNLNNSKLCVSAWAVCWLPLPQTPLLQAVVAVRGVQAWQCLPASPCPPCRRLWAPAHRLAPTPSRLSSTQAHLRSAIGNAKVQRASILWPVFGCILHKATLILWWNTVKIPIRSHSVLFLTFRGLPIADGGRATGGQQGFKQSLPGQR